MRVTVPRPVVRVMVPWTVLWHEVRFFRRGPGRRVALVLLWGAHRAHRQFETTGLIKVGCRGKRWNREGEGASGDQARGAAKYDVHDEGSREEWITPTFF